MLAPALAEVKVVLPVEEPRSLMSELVKVWTAAQVLALPRFNAATTAPVVGEIVSVPLPSSETDETAAAPEQEPQVGGALEPERRHCAAVTVPDRIAKAEAVE